MKKIINVGIVAHVDAGKTSLTEKLYSKTHTLYEAGSIKKANTVTDTLELEKERGITIKSASVSLEWKESKINLIDMPGHIEFFGEVIRGLNVIDVAVLVVSSVGELPTQTRRIFDTLKEAKIPTIFFINKTDVSTAQPDYIMSKIANKLTKNLIDLTQPKEEIVDKIIERDETLLERFIDGNKISEEEIQVAYNKGVLLGNIFPTIHGSAISGEGIEVLLDSLNQIELPSKEKELLAYLYKISFVNGQKQAFFKLIAGQINRYETYLLNGEDTIKMSRFFCLEDNQFVLSDTVHPNEIFMIPNEEQLKIGDWIGKRPPKEITLPKPTLKITFEIEQKERLILLDLLKEMTIEDPLLQMAIDPDTSEISVNIFGRVQKEYVEESLRRRYDFTTLSLSLPKVVYKEVVKEKGYGTIEVDEALNPYWATMALSIEANDDQGIRFNSLVTTGYLKQSFQHAIETSVKESIKTGLYDYELINATITLTDAEFFSPVSTPSEFRQLTPYALYKALLNAGTFIVEPVLEIYLITDKQYLGKAISELSKLEAAILQVNETNSEVEVKARLAQSDYLVFEEKLNDLFKGQAYLKEKVIDYQKVQNQELYQQGTVDRIKSLLIKEN
ncbi:GTP-binding protein [Vagococcus carniphilus]|uniref:GTP-binding protein n=1 Tax=Vagococcus carniphilus TaxID=218144 RepID=A0AAW8U229_9ENTE|nr:GTP-binding protein [Vagococcus carniphilus]MDT2833578.1 GTP-binding protein [Vagococcus carniphilus]